jgi:hypothetical protein
MIVSYLCGGLGNQLFQYAFGYSIARKENLALKLDISHYDSQGLRTFTLGHYAISAPIATTDEIQALAERRPMRSIALLERLFPTQQTFIEESNLRFNPTYATLRGPAYLKGYWQNERYFGHLRTELLQEFTLKRPISSENQKLLYDIRKQNAVSLHIRRGDYVTVEITNKFHGLCSLDYYERAAQWIGTHSDQPVFYVFTDDPEWAIAHLILPFPTVYLRDDRDSHDFEDLYLMSQCKHHIIANSSFSWWGAWLNEHSGKQIIAPVRWFADENLNNQMAGVCPQSWIRL